MANKEHRFGAPFRGVIFRKTYPSLEEIEQRAKEIFFPVYGPSIYREGKKQFDFPRGGWLKLRALEDDKHVYKYIGHQFTDIAFDELTMWATSFAYNYMVSRNRSAAASGIPCQVLSASNPGGPGHHWVKQRFLMREGAPHMKHPPLEPQVVQMTSGRRTRVFIPAKLKDNLILMKNDPGYIDRLESQADPNIRRALMEGDWDILAGAALPELRQDVHLIKNVTPPPGADTWVACDWGYTKPFSVGFFFRNFDGDVIQWAELYGAGKKEGEGTGESPQRVWEKVQSLEMEFGVRGTRERWLDGQHFNPEPGSPSIAQLLGGETAGWRPWSKGPGSRQAKKMRLHEFLKVVNGKARLVFCERCVHTWRTLVAVPVDHKNPEDVDTDSEDHAFDMVCGAMMKDIKSKDEMNRIMASRRAVQAIGYGPVGGRGGW
jgi:hypothetical protein